MCGRYAITLPPEAVRAWFRYPEQPNFPPRYNIAPTQPIPIVCRDDRQIGDPARHFRLVRWGLVPSFVKDWNAFPLLINARAEEIAAKPSFRAAMIRRRCLVIADAYYEWQRIQPRVTGTPFLCRRADGRPMAFAGLHERWMGADGSEMETACIVTTHANGAMSAIHSRMPVILEEQDYETWLDVDRVDVARATALLRPAGDDVLEVFPVAPRVNKVANDDASVQDPVGAAPPRAPARQTSFDF
ncbi:SOS response-associated peptidase [Lichenihabitans sp. PAMC28606]|uniref:SOS response-associated peptidase n=1 Tax=Lichenihabitans sp. PAMC28606 TaxID=2880932 RepID=UPI001D0BBA6E|nr:SOS response-associated peptidase [Lichenihabitans sp. PAMC28606]UDL95031.1 SOS response-associated peptidase [Lichenihabitans sp. PAMC28606]